MATPGSQPGRRFYHERVVALVLGIALFGAAVVDLVFEQHLTLRTLYRALLFTVVALTWFYIFRFPKIRRR